MNFMLTIKNSTYNLCSYIILGFIALLIRKLFTQYLPIEYLGYEGLFGNVFALLSLSDMGIETIIVYRLYAAIARNDENGINKVMAAYKTAYKYVGAFVVIAGLMLVPFIPNLIKGQDYNINYVYTIFFIQLGATLCTYFLAYKRVLFVANQREYICTKVDSICSFFANFCKGIAIVVFQSYIAYLAIGLICNLLANTIIGRLVNKQFSFVNFNSKVSLAELKNDNYFSDLKNNMIQKVSATIWGGTDNLVASILLGISSVGFLSNYLLIGTYVTSFMGKLLNPFQAAIGNLVYDKDGEVDCNLESIKKFYVFDLLSFFIASNITVLLIILFNDFMELWLGNKFVLSLGFVCAFASNQYVTYNHKFLYFYRASFGRYELDRNYILIGAILNLILSIILAPKLGLAGILIGTTVGHLGFWYGRIKVVHKLYLKKPMGQYFIKQAIKLFLLLVEIYICWYITSSLEISIINLVVKGILSILVLMILNLVVFWKTEEFQDLLRYLKKIYLLKINKA